MKRKDEPGVDSHCSYKDDIRRCRKRKAQAMEESVPDRSVDRAVKLVEVTALSVPNRNFSEAMSSTDFVTPVTNRRIVHEISLERTKSLDGEEGDSSRPLYAVSLRNVDLGKRSKLEIEEDEQYEKVMKKAKMWRKLLPCLREETAAEVQLEEPKSKIFRFFLTYAIARELGLKSSIFIKIRNLIVYLFFMVFLIFMSFGMFSAETYHFTKIVSSVFTECAFYCDGRLETMYTVTTLDETLSYIDSCFKSGINSGYWGKVGIVPGIQLLTIPRFRQVRVAARPCLLNLHDETLCYDTFSDETQSKETYGPGTEGFVFSKGDRPIEFPGYYTTYNNNGFTFLISSFNDSYAYLPSREWIDRATAAIFIDFALYDSNTNLFCIVQFIFETPPSGLIRPSHTAKAIFLMRYHDEFGHFVLTAELIVMFLNGLFLVEVLTDLWFFKWRYFTTIGGWYNFSVVNLCWYVGYCLFKRQLTLEEFFETRFLKADFVDFHPVLLEHVHCTTMVSMLFFFSSFKIYHFLSFRLMEHLKITIRTSIKDIVVFVIVFTIILWAFVQVANLLFGQSLEKYRSFPSTFSELTKIMLGDLDYRGPMLIHKVLGPMFILIYVIFAVFVLISMFFAIINSTFTIVSNIVDIELESYCGFLKHCCRKVRAKCYKLRGRPLPPSRVKARELKNSERIRKLLLDSGYSDLEIKLFFCRYIVDDAQELDDAVFEKMWNLRIPPERLEELKHLVEELGKIIDAMVFKADWLAGRIRQIQESRLGRNKPVTK